MNPPLQLRKLASEQKFIEHTSFDKRAAVAAWLRYVLNKWLPA